MTRHLLTLDSLGRDGILLNLELAAQLKARKGMARVAVTAPAACRSHQGRE